MSDLSVLPSWWVDSPIPRRAYVRDELDDALGDIVRAVNSQASQLALLIQGKAETPEWHWTGKNPPTARKDRWEVVYVQNQWYLCHDDFPNQMILRSETADIAKNNEDQVFDQQLESFREWLDTHPFKEYDG